MKFTFKPFKNQKASQDSESSAGEPQNRNQKRREQVRRAQKTHRERKEAYIKSLESEVVELRANEARTARETKALKLETEILRKILVEHNIPLPPVCLPSDAQNDGHTPSDGISGQMFDLSIREPGAAGGEPTINVQRSAAAQPQQPGGVVLEWNLGETSSATDAGLLSPHAGPHPGHTGVDTHNALPPVSNGLPSFDFNAAPLSEPIPSPGVNTNPATPVCDLDLAVIGMDFILTLESPCLHHTDIPDLPSASHSHSHSTATSIATSSSESSSILPTNHALTLSATVLHQHPSPPGHRLSAASTWQIPGPNIERLLELSKSIPIDGNFSLTPVQAWDYIRRHPQFGTLQLVHLEGLKGVLVGLVECHGFGGVLDRYVFEDTVFNTFALGQVV